MALAHEWRLMTVFDWSDIPVTCDGQFLALPITKTVVGIWSVDSLQSKPLELAGHHREITAVCLGHTHFPALLCSASEDYVIVWDLHKARASYEQGETIRGRVVGTAIGSAQSVGFSPDNSLLAVAVINEVLIMSAKTEKLLATLEGHVASVTAVSFCPHYTSTVISISEDRTFKVWDIKEFSLVYQSSIVSAFPFITMAMNPNKEQVAIGTTDGQLRVYDLSDGNGFRCLHHLDVAKLTARLNTNNTDRSTDNRGPVTISSRPSWQREVTPPDGGENDNGDTERGCAILSLCYSHQGDLEPMRTEVPAFIQQDNSTVRDILTSSPVLVIGTSAGLIQVNAFTLEVCAFHSLQGPIPMQHCVEGEAISLSAIGSLHLVRCKAQKVWCIVGSLFQNTLDLLRWKLAEVSKPMTTLGQSGETTLCESVAEVLTLSSDMDGSLSEISFLSSQPLLENSILKSELIPKKKEELRKTIKGKSSSPAAKRGSPSLSDQPLTFKSKVKSSGYTAAPRKTMFRPQTNITKGKSADQRPAQSLVDRLAEKTYPVDRPAPTHLRTSQSVADRPTPINSLHFSGDGESVACGLGNTAIQEFRMPLTGRGRAYTGHNGSVHSVHYSHSDHRFVSSSEDRTARVWVKGQSEPILVIDRLDNNFTVDGSTAGKQGSKENSPFTKDVRCAQFYYVDKFLLLASGSTFYMYKYHLDPTKEDIKRYLTKSRYKLVKCFQLDQAQTITRLQAVNSFYSYISLAAGSDRSLSVFDMNAGTVVRAMIDVHTKPCHAIALNQGSVAVSHPASVYDLFATAAMTDAIKLWDIRTNRCVRRYEGHQNRCFPCGLSLSPCGRFLATGAEDKSAYIYDLRSGTYLHKLTGHTDVVSDVAFHPLKPQLMTACLDGKVRLFADTG